MRSRSSLYIWISVFFCALTLVFFLLYELDIISTLNLYLTLTYIAYFVGLALFFNAGSLRFNGKVASSKICLAFATILVIVAMVALIYGFATGIIELWIF